MNVPFLDLKRGFEAHSADLEHAIAKVAQSGHYILGPQVKDLEKAMAEYLEVPFTLSCASGTDALHLAAVAAGLGPGDEVITTPFTFAATVECIEYVGATPVLVDIDADTFNIDPQRIADAVTPATKAVVPVHLFGLPANMDAIMELAAEHNLTVIEDAAQSLGGKWRDRQTGSIADFGAFSFYPSKTLGCFGDGGLVACQTEEMYERLVALRNHGFNPAGEHIMLGYNSRLDEIQAAILGVKLPQLDAAIRRRRDIAGRYDEAFSGTAAKVQSHPEGSYHAAGYYTILVPGRDEMRKSLQKAGVSTALYYGRPLSHHEHYRKTCRDTGVAVAEDASARALSLPIYPEMTDDEVEFVAETTARAIG